MPGCFLGKDKKEQKAKVEELVRICFGILRLTALHTS